MLNSENKNIVLNKDMIKSLKVKISDKQLDRMKKLYSLDYSKFIKYLWKTEDAELKIDEEWYNNPKTYFNRFRTWLKSIFKVDSKTIKESYKYSKGSNAGRLYVNGFGFQTLKKSIRNYLFYDLGKYDYDMNNAHFKICKMLCTDIPLETPILNEYINNRQGCLNKWKCTKQDVLTMLNCDKWNNGVLKAFHNELKPIKLLIQTNNQNIANKTTNVKNPISSIVNKIFCYYENQLLQRQMKKMNNAHSLYFDGYIGSTDVDINLLNETTKEENITWSVKPFENSINIDNVYDKNTYNDIDNMNHFQFSKLDFKSLVFHCQSEYIENICIDKVIELEKKIKKEKKFEKAKEKLYKDTTKQQLEILYKYMNKYLLVCKGSTISYIFEKKDKHNRMETYTLYKSKKDFRENWEEYTIDNEFIFKTPKEVIMLWLKWGDRRTYDDIVFKPYKHFEYNPNRFNEYNMWSGWEFEYDENFKVDINLIKNILHHLEVVVCDNNKEMYEYTLNLWHLILHGKKTGIGLGLTGVQGCGKSTILEYFGEKILGDKYYAYIQSLDDLTNKFSSLRCMKSFIIVDEIDTWSGDTKTANMLKSILTQTKTKLERKNKDAINIDDFSNYAFISNFKNFLRVEGKGDRRYLIQECNNKYTGNKAYFNRLNKDMGSSPLKGQLSKEEQIRSKLIAKHYFHFLMNRDLTDYDTRDIPQTEILKEMKEDATPVIVSYFYYLMEYLEFHKMKKIEVNSVYSEYTQFCEELDLDQKYGTSSTFSKRSKKSFKLFKKYTKHTNKGAVFSGFKVEEIEDMKKKILQKYVIADDVYEYIKNTMNNENCLIEESDDDSGEDSDEDNIDL